MKYQEQWVINELLTKGKVTRNEALRNYISRLSAIILNLKKKGWELRAKKARTQGGYGDSWDYEYRLINKPL